MLSFCLITVSIRGKKAKETGERGTAQGWYASVRTNSSFVQGVLDKVRLLRKVDVHLNMIEITVLTMRRQMLQV